MTEDSDISSTRHQFDVFGTRGFPDALLDLYEQYATTGEAPELDPESRSLFHVFIVFTAIHAMVVIVHQDGMPNFGSSPRLVDQLVAADFEQMLASKQERPFIYHLTYRDYEQKTYTTTRDLDRTYAWLHDHMNRLYYCGSLTTHPKLFDITALSCRPQKYRIFDSDCIEYAKTFVSTLWDARDFKMEYNSVDWERLGKLAAIDLSTSRQLEGGTRTKPGGRGNLVRSFMREVVENPLQLLGITLLTVLVIQNIWRSRN